MNFLSRHVIAVIVVAFVLGFLFAVRGVGKLYDQGKLTINE
jgi:hypothetical protein